MENGPKADGLDSCIADYLGYCRDQKCLDEKTLKAYRMDLRQFQDIYTDKKIGDITLDDMESFIAKLHTSYKPKTAKRKIASLKAFFHYLSYKDRIERNPFDKIQVKFRAPAVLPKTISLSDVEAFLSAIYKTMESAKTKHQKLCTMRDAAVMELLFATGMRISELCEMPAENINLEDGTILIFGKGSKERMLQIASEDVLKVLKQYWNLFKNQIQQTGTFFINNTGHPLSDQSVRYMINKYAQMAGIKKHITPHMFRHTFATSLLENDVDIRYIQAMLGHSSISTTQIYTHVSTSKQRKILETRHPRNNFSLGKAE